MNIAILEFLLLCPIEGEFPLAADLVLEPVHERFAPVKPSEV